MFCPNPECSHFEQSGRPADFPAGTSHCGHCGAELVDGPPERRLEDVDPGDDDLVPLTRIDDPAFASSFRALLEAEGIRHAVRGEGAGDAFASVAPDTGSTGARPRVEPPMILVDASRVDEARELFETVSTSPEMPARDDLSDGRSPD